METTLSMKSLRQWPLISLLMFASTSVSAEHPNRQRSEIRIKREFKDFTA